VQINEHEFDRIIDTPRYRAPRGHIHPAIITGGKENKDNKNKIKNYKNHNNGTSENQEAQRGI
jgi:hypothetical protein